MQQKYKYLYYILASSLLFLILNKYFSHQFKMGSFFNSDSLTVPDLVRDIFKNPINFFDWNFSRAPSFQDAFFYGLIHLFFNSTNSIAIFISVQFILTAVIMFKIYSIKYDIKFTILLSSISLLFLTYILLEQIYPYFILLKIAHHYSEFLAWLVSSVLLIKFLLSPNRKDMIIIMIISLVLCLNDRLFYLHFIIPSLIFTMIRFTIFKYKKHEKCLIAIYIIGIITVSVIGYIVAEYIAGIYNIAPINSITTISIQQDLFGLYKLILKINRKSLLILLINTIFYIFCLMSILKKQTTKDWVYFFLLSLLITLIIIITVPSSKIIGRYLLPYLYVPVLFLGMILPKSIVTKSKFILLSIIALFIINLMYSVKINQWSFDFYPEDVACIDNELSKRKIQYLIGGFWESRYYTFMSKKEIKVLPFHSSFKENHTVINKKRFVEYYSAVIIKIKSKKGLDEELVKSHFGTPKEEITCTPVKLLLYNHNSLKPLDRVINQ